MPKRKAALCGFFYSTFLLALVVNVGNEAGIHSGAKTMQQGDEGWLDFRVIKEKTEVPFVLSELGLLERLEQRGAELVGWCPFGEHGKKDSFAMNVEKKTFQCFSCKKKGSVLDFVQQFLAYREKRPCGLREAGQWLIEVMERQTWGHLTERKKLYDFLNRAVFTARFSEVA